MKTCPYCNAQIDDNDAVCPYCGQFQYDETQQAKSDSATAAAYATDPAQQSGTAAAYGTNPTQQSGTAAAYGTNPTQQSAFAEGEQSMHQYGQHAHQQYNSSEYQQDYSKRADQQNANAYYYQSSDYTNGYQTKAGAPSGVSTSSRIAGCLSYFSWVGLFIAFFIGDKKDEFTRFHLNQGLVLTIAIGIASLVGGAFGLFLVFEVLLSVLRIIAIIEAVMGKTFKIPVLSDIKLF